MTTSAASADSHPGPRKQGSDPSSFLLPPSSFPAPPSSFPGGLRPRFAALARRMTAAAVAHGVLYWLAGSAAAVLALCLADNLLRLPAALRLAAAALVAGLSLHALWTRVVRPARTPLSAEGAARAAEAASGRGDNLLINACQLEGAELGEGARVLLAPALAEARSAAVGLPQARLLGLRALALWALVALCCAAGWTAYAGRFGDHAANALRRLALPLADVPPVGSVALVLEPSGDVTVAEGDDLALTVRVRALSVSGEQAGAPVVVWAEGRRDVPPDGAGCERLELQAAGPGVWRGRLASLRRDLCLRALCGDAWTAAVRVAVAPMPRLLAPGWRSQAPDYAGQPAVDLPGPPGTATVLPGSRLTFSAEVVPAVGSVVLTVGSATTACTRSRDRWQADITATSAATVLVQAGWAGRTVELARGAIALDQDRPPTVELEGAGGNRVLPPGASIELSFTARDDLGLRRCALTVREASGGRGEPVRSWPVAAAPGPKEAGHKHRLVLDPARFQPGRAYVVEAVAEDWNPAGAPAVSRPLVVRVQNPDEIQVSDAAVRAAIDSLRRAIAREREAEGISDNLLAQGELPPARLGAHRDAIARPQNDARAAGRESRQRFEKAGDLHAARALEPVVEGEMGLVERDAPAPGRDQGAPGLHRRAPARHPRRGGGARAAEDRPGRQRSRRQPALDHHRGARAGRRPRRVPAQAAAPARAQPLAARRRRARSR
ncbi:MAG: DUF4175 domain-containing protein [Planctomycetes bacterium]|nr:DUF4175 domain-containing protein [Planctomycetota bacterium]